MLTPSQPAVDPRGLEGWDQVLFSQTPGQATLYCFIRGPIAPDDAQQRIDALTARLAASGFVTGQPLNVVYVIATETSLAPDLARRLSRLVPAAYYTGLRPVTWVADLAAGSLTASKTRNVPGADALEQAAMSRSSPSYVDVEQAGLVREEQVGRTRRYFQLMQERRPLVTYGLTAINVVIYLLLMANGGPGSNSTLLNFGALSPHLIANGEWWRLFTAMFLHASIPHILFNMMSLVAVGTVAERLYGSPRFLAIYIGAGLAGSLASFGHAELAGNMNELGVGASGAIFGIVGALLTLRFQKSDVIPPNILQRISSAMIPLVILNLAFGVLTPHIDNAAHLGGLVGGAVLSLLLPVPRSLQATGRPMESSTT